MDHVFPASPRRAAAALGALVCTLALCTACTGSSTPGTTGSTATGSQGNGSSAPSNTNTGAANGTGGGAGSPNSAPTNGNGSTTGGGSSSGGGGGTGGSSGGTGGSGGSGGGASACLSRYLNGSTAGAQGTAGSVYVNVVFKNLANTPCTMYGYPGVSLAAGTPVNQVGQPAGRNPAAPSSQVTLQPGGHAYAVLQIADAGNYPASSCQPTSTTYLQVYPPNNTSPLYIQYGSQGCAANIVTMYVEAVQPGTGPQ